MAVDEVRQQFARTTMRSRPLKIGGAQKVQVGQFDPDEGQWSETS